MTLPTRSSTPPLHGFVLSVSLTEEEARRAGTSLAKIAQALRMQLSAMLPAATTDYTFLVPRPAAARGTRPRLAATHRPPAESGLVVDLQRQQARVDGRELALSEREFALLHALLVAGGSAVHRAALLACVWGSRDAAGTPAANERIVDVTVRRLRARLGRYESTVRTVRGLGYRFDGDAGVTVLGLERDVVRAAG